MSGKAEPHDAEPIPGATVDLMQFWETATGDLVTVWRVPCRQREASRDATVM